MTPTAQLLIVRLCAMLQIRRANSQYIKFSLFPPIPPAPF